MSVQQPFSIPPSQFKEPQRRRNPEMSTPGVRGGSSSGVGDLLHIVLRAVLPKSWLRSSSPTEAEGKGLKRFKNNKGVEFVVVPKNSLGVGGNMAVLAADLAKRNDSFRVSRASSIYFIIMELCGLWMVYHDGRSELHEAGLTPSVFFFVAVVAANLCHFFFALGGVSTSCFIDCDGNSAKDEELPLAYRRDCKHCLTPRPLRAKHCHSCGRCVAIYDHHCLWLGCCIGAGNRRSFVALIVLMCTPVWLGAGKVWAIEAARWKDDLGFFANCWAQLGYTTVIVLAYLTLLFGWSILSIQLYLIGSNSTTYDYLRSEKVAALRNDFAAGRTKHRNRYSSAFDYGFMWNWIRFCRGDDAKVISPAPRYELLGVAGTGSEEI